VLGSESSRSFSLPGAKVPGDESSSERKFHGAKVPGSESSTYGTFAPGAKVRGNESSIIRLNPLFCFLFSKPIIRLYYVSNKVKLNPRGGVVGRETANKMSQKQTLFPMVGLLHTRCHLPTIWNSLPHSIWLCESLITSSLALRIKREQRNCRTN